MLFTGQHEHTIDAKQRLAIPAEVRALLDPEQHGHGFYAVPGPNGALWLWPARTFQEMAGAMEQSLLPAEEMMQFEELLFSQAAHVTLDKAGRIRLPERLLELLGLGSSVMVLGIRDHLELHDPAAWRARLEVSLPRLGEIYLRARPVRQQQHGSDRS